MIKTRYKIQNTRYKRAFTLVEALVALSILIVGIISGFILVTKALYNVTIIQDRLTASFLAQEGIELVRQIKDTNYLKTLSGTSTDWDNNLKTDGDYLISADINAETVILLPWQDKSLYYHPSFGLYNYDNTGDATPTVFKRKINIIHVSSDEIRVQIIMDWQSKNIKFTRGIIAEDHLFNWLKL